MVEPAQKSPKTLVLFPEYDQHVVDLISLTVYKFAEIESPLLNLIQHESVDHIAAPSRIGEGRSMGPITVSMESSHKHEDLTSTDLGSFVLMTYEMGKQYAEQMTQQFLTFANTVTAETGNVVSAEGKPISYDLLLDVLETWDYEYEVDENLNPVGIALLLNSRLYQQLISLPPPTPEQEARRRAIMYAKRQKNAAKKRIRKLD